MVIWLITQVINQRTTGGEYVLENLGEDKSIYLQISEMIEDEILRDILKEEEQVPSTTELSKFYKINPATAAKGINMLVDKNILYNSRNIVNLANKGIPITSSKAKKVMDWLYELEIANVENLKVDKTTNHFGWIDDKTFVPYRNNDVQLDLEPGIASWLNKFNEKRGTISQWVANIKEFLDDDETGIIRFIIATRI